MEQWRVMEELERMHEWDTDAVVDALNITTEELLQVRQFLHRALDWVEDNFDE